MRPKRTGRARAVVALVTVVVVAFVALVGGDEPLQLPGDADDVVPTLSWPFGPRVVVDGVRINPEASVNPNRSYTLTLWDYPVPLPPEVGDYEEALGEAIASFRGEYPNVEVSVRLWDRAVLLAPGLGDGDGGGRTGHSTLGEGEAGDNAPDEAEGDAARARLPDVVGGPLAYLVDPVRQVPIESYIDEAARGHFRPGALAAVSDGAHAWGWPGWFDWTAGAVKPRGAAGDGRADTPVNPYVDLVSERFWSGLVDWGSEFSSSPAEVGARIDGLVDTWAERGLVPREGRSDAMEQTLARGARNRLTRFGRDEAALTAPVTPLIARRWAEGDVALLPFPTLLAGGEGGGEPPRGPGDDEVERAAYVPMTPVGYAVLLEKPFAGSDHIRAAMALASHVSREMGAWLAERVPYLTARPQGEEIVPDDWERLLARSLSERPPRYGSRDAYSAKDEAAQALRDEAATILSGARSARDVIAPSPAPQ